MDTVKQLGWSFLVGGLIALVAEVILVLVCLTPLYEMGFHTVASLLLLGIMGGILFVVGVYPKLEEKAGIGAIMPISGLMSAVSGMFCGAFKETGSKRKAAFAVLINLMGKVVLLAIVISAVIGSIYYFTGVLGPLGAPYAPGGITVDMIGPPNGTADGPPNGIPTGVDYIGFIWAFVVGGIIGAVFQAVFMLSRLSVPTFLVVAFTLGAVLVPTGCMKTLVELSGAGTIMYIFDCGEAVVSTFSALLEGNVIPFFSIVGMFVLIYLFGLGFGLIKLSRETK